MPEMIFTMLVVLVLAAAVIAVVVMGMEGTGSKQHPEIAEAMARTARHLNGEGEPPRALVQLFDEMDEVPDLNVREIPEKLRSLRSAASAWSARSAQSANPLEGEDAVAPAVATMGAVALGDEPVVIEPEDVDPEADERSDDAFWAPPAAAPEASDVDESAADQMSAALEAPVVDDPEAADPYGVWGAPDPEPEADDAGEALASAADGDTVVRVRLPEGDTEG